MEAVLTGLLGKYAGKQASLRRSRVRVGRDAGNNLSFPDDLSVSRWHAILFAENDRWFVEDLGSTNGTWVDEQKIRPRSPHRLADDCKLKFGAQEFRWQLRGLPSPPPRAMAVKRGEAGNADWVDGSQTVTVGGIILNRPLAFFGTRLVGGTDNRRNDEEPSLIDPRLPLSATELTDLNRMAAYSALPPGARTRYLRWIARGRTGPIEEPLIRLYLCGLERALYTRDPIRLTPEQRAEVLAELEGLEARYGSVEFVRDVVRALLVPALCQDDAEQLDLGQVAKLSPLGRTPDDWLVAILAKTARPFNAEVVSVLSRFCPEHGELQRSSSDARLFRRIVGVGFERVYPEGVVPKLVAGSTRIWSPVLNYSLRSSNDLIDRLPYVGELPHDAQFLVQKLRSEAYRMVMVYRSLLNRTVSPLDQVAAAHRLPAAVRADAHLVREAARRLRPLAEQRIPIPLRQLTNQPAMDAPTARRLLKQLVPVLGAAGLALAPDPAMGTIPDLGPETRLHLAEMEPITDEGVPSETLLGAVHVGVFALAVRGRPVTDAEVDTLAKSVEIKLNLSGRDGVRLNLHLSWNAKSPPKLRKALATRIPARLREATADLLVRDAESSGAISSKEMRDLVKAFVALGFDEQQLYDRLHHGAHAAPVRAPGKREAKPLEVDPDALARRIAETERVSHLLAEVFAEEAPLESTYETAAQPASEGLEGLLAALVPGDLPWAEFEALAASAGIAPNLAYDRLNELALDRAEGNLLYGDDPVEVDPEILEILRA